MKTKLPILCLLYLLFTGLIPSTVSADDRLVIVAVGDIMMGSTGSRGILPPNDGEDLFKEITPYLAGGDIVFGNLEGPLLDEGESIKCRQETSRFCFEFKMPTRYVSYLKQAGFNALNLANNHTWDFGNEGLKSTLATLGSSGINPLGGKAVAEMEIKGKRVALVGFSYISSPFSFSILDVEKAKEIIGDLKKNYDLVLVSFHGGAEGKSAQEVPNETEIFLNENRGNVRLFSRSVIDAGADLVLGHGPHVLRAMELYKGKLIAYSLGNFLTYGMFNLKGPNGISGILIVSLDLEKGDFQMGRLIPVKLVNGGFPEYDPTKEGVQVLKRLTETSRFNGNVVINDEGEIVSKP